MVFRIVSDIFFRRFVSLSSSLHLPVNLLITFCEKPLTQPSKIYCSNSNLLIYLLMLSLCTKILLSTVLAPILPFLRPAVGLILIFILFGFSLHRISCCISEFLLLHNLPQQQQCAFIGVLKEIYSGLLFLRFTFYFLYIFYFYMYYIITIYFQKQLKTLFRILYKLM